ncbi:antitoxin [Paeniglutamicibacter cryotolerans]|uniref:Uncharacterized protein YjbJ (UPF0337 family) n=1 Tax=Paeniglutamicibacter cryotolerans TaxID=670079 RepID=A0A839QTX9_9MICC|nr:antitoxin [Paeniglutamicibacter cryotolerans]MBB2996732.1 uncharacterized protein YjbJ (UPF0337 family) [Paeniglutamicibacter cryotolerans]
MSVFDELKGKAEELKGKATELVHENADKLHDAVENVGNFVDEKTGGKFAEHVDKVQDTAKGLIDKVDGGETPPA